MNPCIAAIGLSLATAAVSQESTYHNPVDGKDYVAPGGWGVYHPDGDEKRTPEKVRLDDVRLLQDQDELASRTTAQELAAFIDAAHQAAAEVFSSSPVPTVLQVLFTCMPGKCPPSIAYQGAPPRELLQAYYNKLKELPPLRCSGEVKFQFTLSVQP